VNGESVRHENPPDIAPAPFAMEPQRFIRWGFLLRLFFSAFIQGKHVSH
jgi:hypothetical protein